MEGIISELRRICTSFPFKEKMLIVDSFSIGEKIIEACVRQDVLLVNLKHSTLMDLAIELLEMKSPKQFNLVDQAVGSQFVYQLLNEFKHENLLEYFSEMEVSPAFSRAVYQTIQTLRMAGYTGKTLTPELFLTEEKGRDIVKILSRFEAFLHNQQMIDKAELFCLAAQFASKHPGIVYILQSNLSLSRLEEKFLESILPEEPHKLPLAPVNGLSVPLRRGLRTIHWGEPVPLSYLFELEQAKELAHIGLFVAKSHENEWKNILFNIKESGSRLDENIIFYTNGEPYITLIYHMSEKVGIPVTFSEGVPVTFSRPGRLAAGLFKWMKSDYSVSGFLGMLHEGLLEFGEGAPSKSRITKLLRDSQVGWGKERYLLKLNEKIEALSIKRAETEEEEKIGYLNRLIEEVAWLANWFTGLLGKLPDVADQMNYRDCLAALSYLLSNHCKTASALDEAAKAAMFEEIEKIMPFAHVDYPKYQLFEKLEDLALSFRVLQSGPKPGHLHVASYLTGIYHNRQHVFVVGLDNRKFPGNSSEDPLLLDVEREKLGNGLPLLQEKGQEKLYVMVQMLAHSQGRVTVSYCQFDIHDNRSLNPAALFLQCYRMTSGNFKAEYKDLKQLPASLVPNVIIEEKDYWAEKLVSEHNLDVKNEVIAHYGTLSSGLYAENRRQEDRFTEYDGLVFLDPAGIDPRENKDRTMSAGRMESLASCPYSFFLKDILGIRPFEEMEYTPDRWLDPPTRGSLLHAIFEQYYRQLQQINKDEADKERLIARLAEELILKQKEMIPPPNERVFQKEVADLHACCRIFLKEEETDDESYEPLHFEYTFGMSDYEPAELTLPSGKSVKFRGKIDRVDRTPDGSYHIIDYKTGSSFEYNEKNIFKGGRQLQHFIYALAIEEHLKLGAGAVVESSYYFPTVKGLGERYVRSQNEQNRSVGLDILERLIDLMSSGHFVMTDHEDDCRYCDYKQVCRRQFYDNDTLAAKRVDPGHVGLKHFQEVRLHD